MAYAQNTEVSVEKTRAELESMLRRYGADAFGYMVDATRACIQFRAQKRYVKFILPLPDPKDKRFWQCGRYNNMRRTDEAAAKEWEQACRSAWRALLLAIRGKLEATERKISNFETEFLAHIVLPDGSTVADQVLPMIQTAYETGAMPAFTLALPAPQPK